MNSIAKPEAHPVALSAENVCASLSGKQVLFDVSLNLSAGQWTCILGPNGAGKSTLLKALAGVLPHSGRVSLLGNLIDSLPHRVRAQQLAWLGQNETSADDLTVLDVVMLGRLPHQGDWLCVVEDLLHHGTTVVSVLHEITIALHADALVVMRDGRITHHGQT
ncbi:MAG: hypothetical protein RLZZ454_784, partial [Pseudomonadota bacterium]